MPFYESVFIMRSSLSEEESARVVEKMTGALEKAGGTLVKVENWGKKKMAYETSHERKGTYVYVNFEAAGKTVQELERSYRLEDAILKFLTVRLPDRPTPQPVSEGTDGDRVQ